MSEPLSLLQPPANVLVDLYVDLAAYKHCSVIFHLHLTRDSLGRALNALYDTRSPHSWNSPRSATFGAGSAYVERALVHPLQVAVVPNTPPEWLGMAQLIAATGGRAANAAAMEKLEWASQSDAPNLDEVGVLHNVGAPPDGDNRCSICWEGGADVILHHNISGPQHLLHSRCAAPLFATVNKNPPCPLCRISCLPLQVSPLPPSTLEKLLLPGAGPIVVVGSGTAARRCRALEGFHNHHTVLAMKVPFRLFRLAALVQAHCDRLHMGSLLLSCLCSCCLVPECAAAAPCLCLLVSLMHSKTAWYSGKTLCRTTRSG